MATKKLSELSALAVLADADTFLVNDASEAADADKPKYVTGTVLKTYASGALTTAMALIDGLGFAPQFRLSLVSGNPISLTDSTSVGTVYYTPYGGNAIQLYNGSAWEVFTLSELSLALTATSGKNYDIFIDYNAGTPQMVLGSAWTNDTTRADALAYQNGRLVKSGTAAYLYVGTIRADGTNTTIDTQALRFVYNYYNKISKPGYNGPNVASDISFVLGVEEWVDYGFSAAFTNIDGETITSGMVSACYFIDTSEGYNVTLKYLSGTIGIQTTLGSEHKAKFIGEHRIEVRDATWTDEGLSFATATNKSFYVDLWM